MAVGILLRYLQESSKRLRGLVETSYVLCTLRRKTGCIVPSNRDCREDRNIQRLIPLLADLDRIGAMLQIVAVETAHVIKSHTIDTQAIHQLFQTLRILRIQRIAATWIHLEMDAGETCLFRFVAEIIECFSCLLDGAEALHQLAIVEDRHHGTAIDLHIVRTLEIAIDHPIDNRLELIPVYLRVE